jgi:hypothetical protein
MLKNVIMGVNSVVVWVAKLIQALNAEMKKGYHQLVLQQCLALIAEMEYSNRTLPNIAMMVTTKVETAVIMTVCLRRDGPVWSKKGAYAYSNDV